MKTKLILSIIIIIIVIVVLIVAFESDSKIAHSVDYIEVGTFVLLGGARSLA